MADRYVNLHSHSIYSFLDGHALVKDYVARCKAYGHTHAALTDHGTMAGIAEFVGECQKAEITPIVGMEAYVEPEDCRIRDTAHAGTYHLTMLAMNETGYHNLMTLSTIANSEGFYRRPRVDWGLLEQYNEGIIVLSGCTSGELASAVLGKKELTLPDADKIVDFYRSTFPGRYFLEWQNHTNAYQEQVDLNRYLRDLGGRTGLRPVATNDVHYCDAKDHASQQILWKIRLGPGAKSDMGSAYTYVRSNEEMIATFGTSDLVRNTLLIAEMVEPFALGDRTPKLPASPLERPGQSATQTLIALVRAGLEERLKCSFADIPRSYQERLRTELTVIRDLSKELGADFSRYLLMIADICGYCRRERIRFGPRGSAAGSLICWALKISEPDPIKENLYFERFLNPYRVEMPDVDIDFADDRRDEVFAYIRDTYGERNVAKIGTYAMIGAKQALKDSAKAMEGDFALEEGGHRWVSDHLIKTIPDDPRPGGIPLNELMTAGNERGNPMREYIANHKLRPKVQQVVDHALMIEGRARGDGMHAAGVIIADRPVSEILPLALTNQARKEKDAIIPFQTQYEMSHLEKLGLLKVDILGLKTLSVLDATLARINAERFEEEIDPWNIPWNDEKTWTLIRSGRTLSLFQIGSEGLGSACYQLQPESIEDLALTVAVYRPGPMQNFQKIVERKHGRDPIESIHPAIDAIMATTYGFPIYQEQVMEIARTFAGYSLGEADLLRKAMGKKIREKMAEEQVKFRNGALAHGHSEAEADYVWSFLLPFADYGFNRAHAICYAYVAYQTAYLKANYPQAFYAAALTVEAGAGGTGTPQQRIGALVREARGTVTVVPPDVQNPTIWFEPDGEVIRYGLAAIKGMGHTEAESIVKGRESGPFVGLADFIYRSPLLRRSGAETLARIGALPWFNRRTLVEKKETIGPRGGKKEISQLGVLIEKRAKERYAGQVELFSITHNDDELAIDLITPDWDVSTCLYEEQSHLGIFISRFPAPDKAIGVTTIREIRDDHEGEGLLEGTRVTMMGVITRVVHTVTKRKNETMGYAMFLDESDSDWDLVCFHKVYEGLNGQRPAKECLTEGNFVYVRGLIKTDHMNIPRMFVDLIWPVKEIEEKLPIEREPLTHFDVLASSDPEVGLRQVAEALELAQKYPGDVTMRIVYKDSVEILGVSRIVADMLRPGASQVA